MYNGQQSLPALPPITLLLSRIAAIIAGISVVLPPISIVGSLILLIVGMVSRIKRSWKGMLMGLLLSALATTAVVKMPLLVVFVAPVVVWLLYRRWQLVRRYWPALAQGLRLHALLVLWGLAGFWGLEWARTNTTVETYANLWHYAIENLVSWSVLSVLFGLLTWVIIGFFIGNRVRLSWEATSRERGLHGGHPDLAAIFASCAPVMMVLLIMPLLKFDAALLATQWDDLHHALFSEDQNASTTDYKMTSSSHGHHETMSSSGNHHVHKTNNSAHQFSENSHPQIKTSSTSTLPVKRLK